jgi:glyoxylase-like metal-dependent hydrolase (beta-lactamase superfamily II)
MIRITLAACSLLLSSSLVRAHEAMNLDQLMTAFGWNFDTAEIRTQKVTDNLHVLFGIGGNIAVSTGDNGVLIVDDQFPQMLPKVMTAIGELGGESVDFAINTHWHFDHAEGNLTLGPQGTWLVSQKNSRDMMMGDHIVNLVSMRYAQQAYPAEALPHLTYDTTMQFHFNGEQIDLLHTGPAHTTGDTAVIFKGSNAVHLGDVFNNSGYPFVDADNGGDLTGVINFCKAVLARTNANTVVIPGHGEIANRDKLTAYVAMLETLRGRILDMVKAGKSLEEVVAAKLTHDFDSTQGDSTNFVNRAYTSLKREVSGS